MPVDPALAQLQLLLRRATPLIEGAERIPDTPLKFTPGQAVQATVLSALPNGRFLVQIGDRQLDLNLPRNTPPGARLDLRFVGNDPRPTFILPGEGLPPGSTIVALSDTARNLAVLLSRLSRPSGEAAVLPRAAPVLEAPPGDPRELAVALQSAVARSGLFYESHQAQWVAGSRSLAELLREPQARLSEPLAQARAGAPRQEAGLPGPGESAEPPAGGAGRATLLLPGGPGGLGAEDKEPVHPAAAPLVRQQLETLDTRQVVWQGEIWPGQTLRWTIEEGEAGSEGTDPPRAWVTRLALDLPALGEVQALLRLDATGVQIELEVAAPGTRAQLAAHADALRSGFARAGLKLAQVTLHEQG